MHVCVTEIVIMLGEAVLPGHGSGPHLIVELINLPCSAQICPTCPPSSLELRAMEHKQLMGSFFLFCL